MKLKYLFPVLLLFVVLNVETAQLEDELPLPDEKDNQFPPDNPSLADEDNIEGSGAGVLDQPLGGVTEAGPPELEAVEDIGVTASKSEGPLITCPDSCTCSVVADDFIVNCANKDLKEFPSNIDLSTTTLNLQNNKITEIPKYLSDLKSLRILDVSSNSVTDLTPGTVSELPQLKILNLANNRLLKYPQELKNAFSLTSLEELDISGNDMRETLTADHFSNFKTLRKLALPSSGTDVTEILCDAFKNKLQTVCFGSCTDHAVECEDAPDNIGEEYMEASLPGTIALSNALLDEIETEESNDPAGVESDRKIKNDTEETIGPSTDSSNNGARSTVIEDAVNDFSFRAAINKEASVETASVALSSAIVDASVVDTPSEPDIKVGETQSPAKEGVDKSIIGMVVAGMVVVIAGIAIKKNWSSIRKRFSSSPRPASGANLNGAMPEEVPLQDKDKSPV